MKNTKFWTILIGITLVVSCILSVVVFLYNGNGCVSAIYQNGELIEKIHLDTVTTPYQMTITNENGAYNIISIEQGRICVAEASCPDHVCVNTGWISDGVIPIVCLPNELVIKIEPKDRSSADIAAQ